MVKVRSFLKLKRRTISDCSSNGRIVSFRFLSNTNNRQKRLISDVRPNDTQKSTATGCGRKKWTPKFFRRFLSNRLGF